MLGLCILKHWKYQSEIKTCSVFLPKSTLKINQTLFLFLLPLILLFTRKKKISEIKLHFCPVKHSCWLLEKRNIYVSTKVFYHLGHLRVNILGS